MTPVRKLVIWAVVGLLLLLALIARGMDALASALNERYPHLTFRPANGAPAPGARSLPGASLEDRPASD